MSNISSWSDKELSKQITIMEHVIQRSKFKLKQLRDEENRRDNNKDYYNHSELHKTVLEGGL